MRRSLLILFLLVTAPPFALGQVGGKGAADPPDDAKSLLKLTDDLTAAARPESSPIRTAGRSDGVRSRRARSFCVLSVRES